MRFAGIAIASETHVVALVGERSAVVVKPTPVAEDTAGYQKLCAVLGSPSEVLIAMEATGHYWKNLFAALVTAGYAVALLNPLRTHRFAGADLERTKTDAIDALGGWRQLSWPPAKRRREMKAPKNGEIARAYAASWPTCDQSTLGVTQL